MPVAYQAGETRKKTKTKKTRPVVTAPARTSGYQSGPAPTGRAVQRAAERNIARSATAKRTPIRRVAPTAEAIRKTDVAKQLRREAVAQRRRQPYGRGITATAQDIAGLIAATTPGRPAPNSRAVQSTARQLRRAAQPMLTGTQFQKLYGGVGDYKKYTAYVARAREVPVGTLISLDAPGIAQERFQRMYRSQEAQLTRVIAKLPARGGAPGQIPVVIDWAGELRDLSPSAQRRIASIVDRATEFLGTPYTYVGTPAGRSYFGRNPQAFDCSGLINYVYRTEAGIDVGTWTGQQRNAGRRLRASEDYQPGDLLFWHADRGHVGMYLGDGFFIESPAPGGVVQISRVDGRGNPVEVRRIVETSGRLAA